MAKKPILSPDELRQLLRYDPDSGKLYWRARPVAMFGAGKFVPEHSCRIWNSRFAGKEALTACTQYGYRVGNIGGRIYRAHRTAWAIYYGKWPTGDVDHINGTPDDNRIENLRSVTHAENQRNQKRRSSNTSGMNGVGWYKALGKWRCHITVDGVTRHLGYFDSFEEAVAARKAADIDHEFHENHGR